MRQIAAIDRPVAIIDQFNFRYLSVTTCIKYRQLVIFQYGSNSTIIKTRMNSCGKIKRSSSEFNCYLLTL